MVESVTAAAEMRVTNVSSPKSNRFVNPSRPIAVRICAIASEYKFTPFAVQAWRKRGLDLWDDAAVEAHVAKVKSRAISDDVRTKIIKAHKQGMGRITIGRMIGISPDTCREIVRREFPTPATMQRRVRINLACRIAEVLRRSIKTERTQTFVGCTWNELRLHLERQFKRGMSWDNYGTYWHVQPELVC